MSEDLEELTRRLRDGEKKALARAITLIENGRPEAPKLVKEIYPETGNAEIVGIIGTPGTGKSTLLNEVINKWADEGVEIGITAIDPSSAFTGGALLGDRVRMSERELEGRVFFRSMGSRGASGGLSQATGDVVKVMDAFGMDIIFIETVGIGQGDVDIFRIADSRVVVLMPEIGDEIQAMKAGIYEIGDIFVINKADLEGSELMAQRIRTMLEMERGKAEEFYSGLEVSEKSASVDLKGWRPPVLMTIAKEGKGVDKLLEKIKKHLNYLRESGELERRREKCREKELMEVVRDMAAARISKKVKTKWTFKNIIKKVAIDREMDPRTAAEKLISEFNL